MEEIWKDVSAHPRYQISNLGRLKRNGIIVSPWPNSTKKPYLICKIDGRKHLIHRLVAVAFIRNPNPSEYNQVNHLNGLKQDNRVVNLEWCNNRMNQQHAVKIGLHKPMEGDINGAAKIFGIGYGTIRDIRNGKNWQNLDWYRNRFI